MMSLESYNHLTPGGCYHPVLTKKKHLDTDTANETEKQACIANKQKTKIQTQQSVSRAHSLPAACQ